MLVLNNVSMATMVEFLAKKNNVSNSLAAINSAILSNIPIVIGFTDENLRFGEVACDYLHIGGKSIYWPVGYADKNTVAEELQEHAASLGREANIKCCRVASQMGCTGCVWWRENSHQNRFTIREILW